MKGRATLFLFFALSLVPLRAHAEDWPQWRGANRDAKVTSFKAPASWPKELKQAWKLSVGDGVATPALVGDRLYVFARQEGNEIVRCLEASSGKVIWQDKYPAKPATGPSGGFAGPRSSPVVNQGKVVTLGVSGTLSCFDTADGKLLWRKDDTKNNLPTFFTSSSPMIVDDLCLVQLGGGDMNRGGRDAKGMIVAYDLATGTEKWKWDGDGTAYASPVLQTLDGKKVMVAETAKNIVGISLPDGKLLWQTAFAVEGRGYNASTPLVEGSMIIFGGFNRGTRAMKIEKQDDKYSAKELWTNKDNSVIYNTPVIKNGLLFALSSTDNLFCINVESGKTAWTAPLQQRPATAANPPAEKGPPGKGGGRGMRSGGGYGNIIDAGSVLLVLTPKSPLIIAEMSDKEFKQIASYKVGEGDTYAYPVVDGNRIFIKDKDSVTLWTLE